MPRFEVFVPAAPPKLPIDLTLRIDAEHWLAALKTGLMRIGETHMANNVLCDIQGDGSIHVTDPDSGRVFRIQELPQAQVTAPPAPPPVAPAPVAAELGRPPPPPSTAPAPIPPPPVGVRAATPMLVPQAARAGSPVPRATPARPSAQADRVEEAPAPASPPLHQIGRITQTIKTEDVLADLFLEVAELQGLTDRKRGLEYLLDLAMRSIGCESGSVFTTDLSATELEFAAVRGPAADKIVKLGLTVPMGVGLVGFCAQENVCVAVSDVEKDPRFHRAVSEAIGHETRSLLCAPVASRGVVRGALEVLNKKGGQPFGQKDLAILSYLAAQAAQFLDRLDE
jgi:hypothetical protein